MPMVNYSAEESSDQALLDQMKRSDYYLIIKLKHAEDDWDKLQIRWQGFRRKFSILNYYGRC